MIVCCMNVNLDILHLPCCHYHATCQHQLCRFTIIHKSCPMASWDSKVSIIWKLQNLAGRSRSSGYFLSSLFSFYQLPLHFIIQEQPVWLLALAVERQTVCYFCFHTKLASLMIITGTFFPFMPFFGTWVWTSLTRKQQMWLMRWCHPSGLSRCCIDWLLLWLLKANIFRLNLMQTLCSAFFKIKVSNEG